MLPAGSVVVQTDVADTFRATGKGGVRLRITSVDAELYSTSSSSSSSAAPLKVDDVER